MFFMALSQLCVVLVWAIRPVGVALAAIVPLGSSSRLKPLLRLGDTKPP